MSYANGPRIVTDGLVLHLDAANRKSYPGSGTSWNDLSGSNNNVTLYNGPSFINSNGGYLSFDGTNDFGAGVVNGLNPNSGCTLETFVRRPTTPPAWRTYFNIKPNSGSNTPFYELRATGAALNVAANYYYNVDYITSAQTINNTSFYHFITTYDGSGNIRLYINGSLFNTKTSVPSFTIGSNPKLNIARAYSDDRPTNIHLVTCKIYSRALSANEVQQNYNALKGRFGL
jgi:hypothetical protein